MEIGGGKLRIEERKMTYYIGDTVLIKDIYIYMYMPMMVTSCKFLNSNPVAQCSRGNLHSLLEGHSNSPVQVGSLAPFPKNCSYIGVYRDV